jgi:hypothetical protein
MPSGPTARPLFNFLIAKRTSATVGESDETSVAGDVPEACAVRYGQGVAGGG